MSTKENALQLRIERGKKTSDNDIQNLYYTIYKLAENLGFNVVAPEETNQKLILLTEKANEKKKNL
tara:strand:- start:2043 stop:2240 length:198 start_codon:yes stop_codon:yes gene_type:complete